jgi:hypothetical protein
MKNKVFLAILLLTPILVVTFSSLYFSLGYSPEGTKNNGIFLRATLILINLAPLKTTI